MKSNVREGSAPSVTLSTVNSSLAHMSPSSPVSVGVLPSNRTLVVGVRQTTLSPSGVTEIREQTPFGSEPFTDTTAFGLVEVENRPGTTAKEKGIREKTGGMEDELFGRKRQ